MVQPEKVVTAKQHTNEEGPELRCSSSIPIRQEVLQTPSTLKETHKLQESIAIETFALLQIPLALVRFLLGSSNG